jgi:hypothetical protein
MMRISCHGQCMIRCRPGLCESGNGNVLHTRWKERECKVRNERQLSKKLKCSNAEEERTKRMEDK